MGGLSRWSWPDIEGLDKYKGALYHSAQWDLMEGQSWQDTVKDWGEKTVGVIGVVSSLLMLCIRICELTIVVLGFVRYPNRSGPPVSSETPLQLCPRKDVVISSVCQ